MYYINKIIGCVVSPVGLAIIGGAGALICARLKRQRVAKWLGWLTVAWLWLWMTPIMTWVVGVPLEREFLVDGKVPAVETFPEADAIVLLGGGMGVETNLSQYAEMATSADRVWQAARLFKAGQASKLIATGDYTKDQYEAFYQKTLEPMILAISQAFTKKLFTTRERAFGNRIELYPKELIFMTVSQTLEMINILSPTGGLFENEKRVALGLRPLPELEGKRYMSLNWIDAENADQYQVGKVNVDVVDEEKQESVSDI